MQATINMHQGFGLDHFATKTPGDDGGVNDGVNENRSKIIALMKENSRITIPQVARLSGLSERTVQREIKVLVDNIVVVRKGGRSTGT